jgi:hypothetical protein
MTDKQEAIAAKKLAADEKARAKAAASAAAKLKAQKDQTKALKEQAKLKKANTLFDIEQAGIIAALQGDISREERNETTTTVGYPYRECISGPAPCR